MIAWLLKELEKNPTTLFRKKELLKKSKKQFEQLKRQGFLTFVQPDPHHETYPCNLSCSNTCPMEVVEMNGQLFAICPKDTEVDPIPMETDDLSKYSFSVDKLLEQIHTVNELDGSLHRVSSNYSYIGYKTCNNSRVGFVFISKIGVENLLELSGLKQLCEDDNILVVLTPASETEEVTLKARLHHEKIVQTSLVSSLNLQTFELPIEELISGLLKPRAEHGSTAKPKGKSARSKISREAKRNAEKTALIAALLTHHKFSDDKSLEEVNTKPAKQENIGGMLDWRQDKVCKVIQRSLPSGFWKRYLRACKTETLRGFLKKLEDDSTDIEAVSYRPLHPTEREEKEARQYE